ncbi:MAG: DUF5615 family PIN-like protein [Thermoanaerobaculaceae bacterium]
MARFLVDEDMPRSLASVLALGGHDAADVRDVDLRGGSDEQVFARAQGEGRTLVTADLGFANLLRFPLGSHAGIVVVRLPNEMPAFDVVRTVAAALVGVSHGELAGSLMIVEQKRIRMRQPHGAQP